MWEYFLLFGFFLVVLEELVGIFIILLLGEFIIGEFWECLEVGVVIGWVENFWFLIIFFYMFVEVCELFGINGFGFIFCWLGILLEKFCSN